MKITILAVGKKHDAKLETVILDYTNRLKHYTELEWKLLEAKLSSAMTEDEIRTAESSLLLSQCKPENTVILLDERGSALTSPALAEKLQNYMNRSTKNLVFIIGGAYGVNKDLLQRANVTWSLSSLVFPHQLVRLILVEQLYRAHTILAGEKYHHS